MALPIRFVVVSLPAIRRRIVVEKISVLAQHLAVVLGRDQRR